MRTIAMMALLAFVWGAGTPTAWAGSPGHDAHRALAAVPEHVSAAKKSKTVKKSKKSRNAPKTDPRSSRRGPALRGSAPRGAFQNPSSGAGPGPAPSNRSK
jgi:hypothetical protein